MSPAPFYVFEGADGVGKSTQVGLLARHLEARGANVLVVREPGATALGEQVRRILLDPESGEIDPATEMFLFMAARAHLTARRIVPALEAGRTVICDRYLWSTAVYQGIVGGVGVDEVMRAGRVAGVRRPTRTFLIDVPPAVAAGRRAPEERSDRMESRGRRFQEQVRRGFLALARRYPREAAVIDGRGAPEEVHRRILDRLPRPAGRAGKG